MSTTYSAMSAERPGDVRKHFLEKFLLLYGEPKTTDVGAFFAEYQRALKGYTAQALEAGANKLIDAHTFKSWPTIAECRKAIESAMPRAQQYHVASEWKEDGPEAKARTQAVYEQFVRDMEARSGGPLLKRFPRVGAAVFADRGWQPSYRLSGEPVERPEGEAYHV